MLGSPPLRPFAEGWGLSGRYLPPHPPGSEAERGWPRLGEMGRTCQGHYPHLPPGELWPRQGAETRECGRPHLAAGRARSGLRRRGSGALRSRAKGEGGGLGRAPPRGTFLGWERCSCEQLFLVCQAGRAAASPGGASSWGPGRGKAARRPEAGRMRTGYGRGGASPPGGAAVRRVARERVRGPGHGLLADGGIPWARLSDHKGRCGREPPGAAGGRVGRTEAAAGWPAGGGRRGCAGAGHSGRAAAAQPLLKSKQPSGLVLRAASGSPLRLPRSAWVSAAFSGV